ncbi:hypothetical protein ABH988_005239 [Bradyrhizobium ottawaense]
MRVAAEALEEAGHLLVHHRVMGHAVVEILLLRGGRQIPEQQEIAGLEEVAVLGELLDRVAAVFQHARVAVDIGDLRLAARGGGEAGIVGEQAGLAVELADIDDIRPDAAAVDREIVVLVSDRQRSGLIARFCVHRRSPMKCEAGRSRRPPLRDDGAGRMFQKVRGRWVYYCCVRCKITARMLDLRLSLVLGLILKPAEAFLASQDVQNLKYTRRRRPPGQRGPQGLGDRAELETIFLGKSA